MSNPLVAADVRVDAEGPDAVLSCAVRGAGGDLPPRLWLRVPAADRALLSLSADAFLPVLLVAAMQRRQRLVLEGPVSPALLAGARRVMAIFERWSERAGEALGAIEIVATPAAPGARGEAAAAFFSAGVDSFYTLLSNHARYPVGDSRLITHLVVMQGYDLRLDQDAIYGRLLQDAGEVAGVLDKRVVPVRTNIRAALESVHWNRYGYGTMLTSVGHALSAGVHTVYVPSSGRPFPELAGHDVSSTPELCAWWSTETLEFVYHPVHLTRTEKIRFLARSPLALAKLRVCWENRDGAYNCGRCEKCLRTMVELALCGVLAQSGQFPPALDLARIEALSVPPRIQAYWRRLLEASERSPEHAALAAALRRPLERLVWGESRMGRMDRRLSATLARLGLTGARARRLDDRLLGGGVAALLRRLQRRAFGS